MQQKSKNSKKKVPKGQRTAMKLARLLGEAPDQQSFKVGRNLIHRFIVPPPRPMPGARLTTRQIAGTFNTQSGLTNVGGGAYAAAFVVNSATATLASIAFRLDDLTQASSFSALFDQYRIERVRLHIKSRNNATLLANTASPNAAMPSCYLVVDRDDSTAPAALTDLFQYDNVISFNGGEDAIVDLVPSATPAVYASGAFTGYSTKPSNSVWLDMANSDVPMYGVKLGGSGLTVSTTSAWTWDIIPEYVVSFKNTR